MLLDSAMSHRLSTSVSPNRAPAARQLGSTKKVPGTLRRKSRHGAQRVKNTSSGFTLKLVQVSPGTRSQVRSLTPKRRVKSGSNPGHRKPVPLAEGATWSRRKRTERRTRCSRSTTTGRSFLLFPRFFHTPPIPQSGIGGTPPTKTER